LAIEATREEAIIRVALAPSSNGDQA